MNPGVRTPRVPSMHQAPAHPGTANASPRQQAVADWLASGIVVFPAKTVKGILPKEPARQMAALMEAHFERDGVSAATLTAWWRNYEGGMALVRLSPAFIPFITDALIGHLREIGHA